MVFYIAILIWVLMGIPIAIWLFSSSGGWEAVKDLPFQQRLRVMYSKVEREKITDEKLREYANIFSKRYNLFFYLYFIIPQIAFYGMAYYVYVR